MTQFAGSHTTIGDLLGGGSNFVIPEYQREYSWKEEDVRQLVHDIDRGIKKLDKTHSISARKQSGSKFLGCVIQWEREAIPHHDYIPAHGTQFINRVNELIDGQQRTSSIILLLCQFYLSLEVAASKLDHTIIQECELLRFVKQVQDQWLLPKFSRVGLSGASPSNRPALVRQGLDMWSHSGVARYSSAIAVYVHELLCGIEAGRPTQPQSATNQEISEVVQFICEELNDRANDPPNHLDTNYDQSELLFTLVNGRPRVDLTAYLASNPKNSKVILEILDVVAVTHYLLNYCAVTLVSSLDQDTALDMFQSLNSTGVQLTAIQLLKPRISQTFRQSGAAFASDSSFAVYNNINSWANKGSNSKAKTHKFFLKFSLAVFGEETGNSLSSQRSWLQTTYLNFTDQGTNLDEAKKFIRLMSHTVGYLESFCFKPRVKLFESTSAPIPSRKIYEGFKLVHDKSRTTYYLSDPAVIAMMFIIDSDHDMAHSVLNLYFAHFQEANSPAGEAAAKQEFEKAILSTAGFFVTWRSCFSEKYPDDAYRSALGRRKLINTQGKASEIGDLLGLALAKKQRSAGGGRSFVDLFSKVQYRSSSKAILRFVLLLAAHKKVVLDVGAAGFVEHGMIKADPAGPDYLFPDIWLGDPYRSIEHVAPQLLSSWGPPIPNWSPSLNNASDAIHSIGNLTLLSIALNASTPESTLEKANHYSGLVAPGAAAGVTPKAAALMAASPLLSHLIPVYLRLSNWNTDIGSGIAAAASGSRWDEQFIDKRAKNIAAAVLVDLRGWILAR